MEQTTTIQAPQWATWLGEQNHETGNAWMTEIPANCLFNKGKTGCGGTELAINQAGHTIIAMPFINLARNKEIPNERRQHDVLAVYGDVDNDAITDFARKHDTLKILVTYDSLPRVVNVLSEAGYNVYRDFFLLVDEYHILFNHYSFRHKAIKRLLAEARNFERATYMSATPIEQEFLLEELKGIPTVAVKWADTTEVTVQSRPQKKPVDYVAHLCRQVIEQNRNGNLHFFVNSVKFIDAVIKKANLSPEQVRIVCADSDENVRKLSEGYPIEMPSDPAKKVNFYTSTAFEGCDIYDRQGRIYIVSDATKAQTLVDISTLFIQICGRIRDSIYNTEITHIFSTTRYSDDLTLEEFTEATRQTMAKAVKLAADTNAMPNDSRETLLSNIPYLNEKYVRIENNRLIVDRNLANIDIVNFKITKHIYRTAITLSDELRRNGFGVEIRSVQFASPAERVEMNPRARVSFEELFNEYADLREQPLTISFDNPHYKLGIIAKTNPLVKEAYDKLGRAEVERLKYNQTNIRREILKKSDLPTEYRIVRETSRCLDFHVSIPKATIKEKLQSIYDALGLNRTAKATDLNSWYETKETTRTIDGRNTACLMIVREKLLRTDEAE